VLRDEGRDLSIKEQAKEVFGSPDDTLAKAGASKRILVFVQIFLPDTSNIDAMNDV
jgi:enamine deaminase RidA (YjgF/YER057c/UK114 family)